MDSIKSHRLVLQKASIESVSVNTTFHPEPPAWQACLWICFGFGVCDYGNKSLVHSGSKLKQLYTDLKAWCFYCEHKRLSQGLYILWHHLNECLVAKSWNEVTTTPTEFLIKTHLSHLFYLHLSLTVHPKSVLKDKIFFFFFVVSRLFTYGYFLIIAELKQKVIPGIFFSGTLTTHPVKSLWLW